MLGWTRNTVKELSNGSTQTGTSPRHHIVNRWLVAVSVAAMLIANLSPLYASRSNYLPDIALTTQDSRPITLSSLRGQPVLVGFIHTLCKGVCQMMTANMRSVASALPAATAGEVKMVLITTDPSEDQPPQLRQYARAQDLSGKEWILVTGPEDNIHRVMRLYGVKHEDTDDAMMHVMKLFLVAPNGALVRVYPGMKLSPQAVASDIENLSHNKSDALPSRDPAFSYKN